MLIFAGAVDKDRRFVQVEAVVAILAEYRPRNVSDSEWRSYLVGSLAVTLNHRRKVVEIWIVKAPAMDIFNMLSMADCLALPWLQR